MSNDENEAKAWHDREFAEKFVANLEANDRITVYRQADSKTGSVEEHYVLHRPPDGPTPIFMSGDCAAVRQAIASGLLERTAREATLKKREAGQNPGPD